MKTLTVALALFAAMSLLPIGAAQAAGCLKGAAVGGAAGHFVHHGWLGAAAGCMIGRHEANKHTRQSYDQNYDANYR